MGYKVGNYKGKSPFYNAKEILCDTFNDLTVASSAVNCGAGSIAYILDVSERYVKNTAGQWVKQKTSSSGGGGTVDPDTTYIYDGGTIGSTSDFYVYDGGLVN